MWRNAGPPSASRVLRTAHPKFVGIPELISQGSGMNPFFGVKRSLIVFAAALIILFLVYVGRGRLWKDAALESLLWSFISAVIYFFTARYHARRGRYCALCGDVNPTASERPADKIS
jgi:hypothetical protein